MGLSALNFTFPVKAERRGHALQTANRFLVFTNQIIYSINQITLEHGHEKYCGSVPLQPARQQQGQLIWRGTKLIWKKKM